MIRSIYVVQLPERLEELVQSDQGFSISIRVVIQRAGRYRLSQGVRLLFDTHSLGSGEGSNRVKKAAKKEDVQCELLVEQMKQIKK